LKAYFRVLSNVLPIGLLAIRCVKLLHIFEISPVAGAFFIGFLKKSSLLLMICIFLPPMAAYHLYSFKTPKP
jgi:hypothetical protein